MSLAKLCVIWMMLTGAAWGQTVLELLTEFRGAMTHSPGTVSLKSAGRTWADGGGSEAELTQAFRQLLASVGYETMLMRGRVRLSAEQLADWLPVDGGGMKGLQLTADGRWEVPLLWLRVRAEQLPGMDGMQIGGGGWLDVFPALVCAERLTGRCEEASPAVLRELAERWRASGGGAELEWDEAVREDVMALQREVRQVLLRQQRLGRDGGCLAGGGGIAGYRSERVLGVRPVEVLEAQVVEEEDRCVLAVSVVADGVELARLEQDTAVCDDDVCVVDWFPVGGDGSWIFSETVGTVVLGRRLQAVIRLGGKEVRSAVMSLPGTAVRVRFELQNDGGVQECLEDEGVAGSCAAYAFSQGYSRSTWEREVLSGEEGVVAMAKELRYRLDRYGRLLERSMGETCMCALRLCKAVVEPVGESRGGCLWRLEKRELMLCGLENWGGSRAFALASCLGQACVAQDLAAALGVATDMETVLDIWQRELIAGDGVRYGSEVGRFGLQTAAGTAVLEWDDVTRSYDGGWQDRREAWRDGRLVRVGRIGEEWRCPAAWADEGWLAVLVFLNGLTAQGIWGGHESLGELAWLSVFGQLHGQLAEQCRLSALDVEVMVAGGTGRAQAAIRFNGAQTEEWTVQVMDSEGRVVWERNGTGASAELEWNGEDNLGKRCADGIYTVSVILQRGEQCCRGSRSLEWDATAPEVQLLAYVETVEGERRLVCEYDIQEAGGVSAQLRLLEGASGDELKVVDLAGRAGRWEGPVPLGAGDVCVVEVSAVDEVGNGGGVRAMVVLGSVYVGGQVWSPSADGGISAGSGELAAEVALEQPSEEADVLTGQLVVTGSAHMADGTALPYQLRLLDATGRLMACRGREIDGRWCLEYAPPCQNEEDVELVYPTRTAAVSSSELAFIDVSAVPNGIYTLKLVGIADGKHKQVGVSVNLFTELKIGVLTFMEEDGKARIGQLQLALRRTYSSLAGNSGCGWGWTTSLEPLAAELTEEREILENADGRPVSVRTGGNRNVTLMLPDGGRCTFRFALVPGGGWSYAYYGSWTAPRGVKWQLRATVSSDVQALPGLAPYWKAAGPSVPLENYDFPGFVLTGPDGTAYYLAREKLGDYAAAGDDGGEIATTCYGALSLMKIVFADGRTLSAEDGQYSWLEADGTRQPLLKTTRDATGRLASVRVLDGWGTVYDYAYDGHDNLVTVSKSYGGAETQVLRRYGYGDSRWPHLLTRIENGSGRLLAAFAYDDQGRMVENSNGTGSTLSVRREVFSRCEIQTDSLGNETLARYDEYGNVREIDWPDGGTEWYDVDEAGRVLSKTDALGNVTRWTYDGAGCVTAIRDAAGNVTQYVYGTDGTCCAVTDAQGRVTRWSGTTDRGSRHWQFGNGLEMDVSRNGDGKVTVVGRSGEPAETVAVSYGDGEEIIADGCGQQLTRRLEQSEGHEFMELSWVDDDGAVVSVSTDVTLDEEGRVLSLRDELGNWTETERDSEGNKTLERDSGGGWHRWRYDVAGRCVEETDAEGHRRRSVYAANGSLLLQTAWECGDREEEDAEPGEQVFEQATVFEYDSCGRVSMTRKVTGTVLGMRPLGGGRYECTVVEVGRECCQRQTVYDLKGQPVQETDEDGGVVRMGYDCLGRLSWRQDACGGVTRWRRNAAGRLVEYEDAVGGVSAWEYDDVGNVSRCTGPDGRSTSYVRGRLGQPVRVSESGRLSREMERDGAGRLTAVREGKLQLRYERGAYGMVERVSDGDGWSLEYGRDALQRVVSVTSGAGRWRRWRYEGVQADWCEQWDGAGRAMQAGFDDRGRRLYSRALVGERCQYEVRMPDDDHRQVLRDGGLQWLGEWRCDALQRPLMFMVNGEEVAAYGYDDCGRINRYDGRVLSCEREFGAGGTVTCCRWRRLGENSGAEKEIRFTVDGLGRIVAEETAEIQRFYAYDAVGRLKSVSMAAGGQEIYRASYAFDDGGRRTALAETGRLASGQVSWEYDAAGRLVRECRESDRAAENLDWHGEYDALGNLLWEERQTVEGTERTVHEYDIDGCLLRSRRHAADGESEVVYEWDGAGALVSEVCTGTENWERRYEWSGEGLLLHYTLMEDGGRRICEVVFEYDGYGMLCGHCRTDTADGVTKVTEHRFNHERVINSGLPAILEYEMVENGVSRGTAVILTGLRPLGVWEESGCRWLCYDGHGGLRGQLAGGAIVSQAADSWGASAGGMVTGVGVFGEWVESGSGLVYLRGRFYSPRLRRFLYPDSRRGEETEPQTWHPYVYCRNDPVNYVDPTGTMGILAPLGVLTVGIAHFANMALNMHGVLLLAQSLCSSADMAGQFARQPKEKDNALVYVHGISWHNEGWSRESDCIHPILTGNTVGGSAMNNQDCYEFLWSGFTLGRYDYLMVPVYSIHLLTKYALLEALAEVYMKGYRHLNIISHSWGTVLSHDVQEEAPLQIDLWATLGSPLGICQPFDTVKQWLNFWNDYDPVTDGALLLYGMGYVNSPVPLKYMSDDGCQQMWLSEREKAHTCYWQHEFVIRHLKGILRRQ